MQASGLVDQLLDVHRNCHGLGDAACARASFRSLRDLRCVAQAGMDFGKTSFDGFVDDRAVHLCPLFCGDSDALVAAEVERIRSNLVALIAPL